MKPWPPELLAMFPLDARMDRHPQRPWWIRRSGYWLRWTDQEHFTVPECAPDAEAAMEAIDAANPVDHPGFRVGQVWAIFESMAFPRVDSMSDVVPIGRGVTAVQIICYDFAFPSGTGPWRLAYDAVGWADRNLRDYLKGAYLVSDSACPHLAPWSPA